jgi:IPT/TIG domain
VPPRLPATGGPIVIDGIGFRQNSVVSVNGVSATVTSVSPTQITAVAPASAGITGNVLVQMHDPQTLGVAIIADGLSYDAQNGDELAIVTAPANTVALGVPLSFTVKAMNWNNQVPAAGVIVNYAVTYGSAALGCGQITCNVMTAGDGTATIPVSATSNSLAGVTASLSNGANIAAEFTGGLPFAISAITPNLYLAIGATAQWNPQGLVMNNGVPSSGAVVTWTPSASSVSVPTTDSLSSCDGIVKQQIAAGPLNTGDVIPVNACLMNSTTALSSQLLPCTPRRHSSSRRTESVNRSQPLETSRRLRSKSPTLSAIPWPARSLPSMRLWTNGRRVAPRMACVLPSPWWNNKPNKRPRLQTAQ